MVVVVLGQGDVQHHRHVLHLAVIIVLRAQGLLRLCSPAAAGVVPEARACATKPSRETTQRVWGGSSLGERGSFDSRQASDL